MTSFFAALEMAPRDPILGLTEAFNADTRSTKINLGVGVYTDDNGKVPLLSAVKAAEDIRLKASPPRGYQPIDGSATYNTEVQNLLFPVGSPLLTEKRVITAQTLGGTGALKVGGDFLKRFNPDAKVYISDPSWENHRAIFEGAGFPVETYPYYDATTRGVNFAGMTAKLGSLPENSIVLLHTCCHNPTGADLTPAQWKEVVAICKERGLIPFLDMAYQGFSNGIEQDAIAVHLFSGSGLRFLVSSSFSKSFSLYGERVGALSIVCATQDEASRALSQLKRVIRCNYSSPPTHGGAIVSMVLKDPALRKQWEDELAEMRNRIRKMRMTLADQLKSLGTAQDFSFITQQHGMFSYTGLSSAQIDRLKEEFGIYAVSSGRICVAALNSKNVEYVANSVSAVVASTR